MGGEVLQNLHVDVHTHPCGDGDEQGVGGHDGGVGVASDTDTSVLHQELDTHGYCVRVEPHVAKLSNSQMTNSFRWYPGMILP